MYNFLGYYFCLFFFLVYSNILGTSLQVPYLNSTPIENLASGSLVRFRCMVKDMFDPEYYLGVYEEVDQQTGLRVCFTQSAKYS